MKGRAIFATVPGEPNPPSTDPIALLNYALQRHPESVSLVNFAGSVKEKSVRRAYAEVASDDPSVLEGLLLVEAPVVVCRDLEDNLPEEQDAYLLIHISRAVVDEMDSPVERPLIVLPPGVRRPS